jgi:hypothetical protein
MVAGDIKKIDSKRLSRSSNVSSNSIPAPSEAQEARWLVKYWNTHNIPHYAIPNGGYRKPSWVKNKNGETQLIPIEAKNLKLMGVKKGMPDYCIPIPRAGYTKNAYGFYASLYIELKKSNGSLKDLTVDQRFWIDFLRKLGHKVEVAFGWVHAMQIANEYLGLKAYERFELITDGVYS